MPVKIKRIYKPYSKEDGYRILIDRLWPRGIKKEDVHIDEWLKEIAPSTGLRKWFHQTEFNDTHWKQFVKAYRDELKKSDAVEALRTCINQHETVTLLFASKNEQQNHALILLEFLSG
jgi:uncharacterized protein YeaO (DUF488 family)